MHFSVLLPVFIDFTFSKLHLCEICSKILFFSFVHRRIQARHLGEVKTFRYCLLIYARICMRQTLYSAEPTCLSFKTYLCSKFEKKNHRRFQGHKNGGVFLPCNSFLSSLYQCYLQRTTFFSNISIEYTF